MRLTGRRTLVIVGLVVALLVIQFRAFALTHPDGGSQVLFFQMGHDEADFLPGAIPVTISNLYRPHMGYGWIHAGSRGTGGGNLVASFRSGDDPPAPDSITGNCIFWRGGDMPLFFRVDVPDGEYRIWIYSGLFGHDRFYDTIPFQISAQGNDRIEYDPREGFRERFFEELDDSYEYTPDWTPETMWEKYIKKQGAAVFSLTARAANGYLNVRFDMPLLEEHKERLARSDARMAINALIICPAARAEEGEKKLEEIETERRRQYSSHVTLVQGVQEGPLPQAADEFRSVGFVPFVRNFMNPVFAESIPMQSEIGKTLRMSAAQGQREIASFALHPLRDIEQASVEVGPLRDDKGNVIGGADSTTLHWIRYMVQPVDYAHRTAEYRGVPLLMREYKPLDLKKGMNRQYILAVTVPEDAIPGLYRGQVTVTPKGGMGLSLDLEVEVYPFSLETYADDDERIWLYFGDQAYKAYGDLLMSEEDRWRLIDKDLAFMKQQLMAPTILFDWFPDDDELDRFMELYTKYGFKGFATFGDYSMLRMVDRYYEGSTKEAPDAGPFIDQIKHVLKRKEEKGWPDIAFYTFAEMKSGMPGYQEAKKIMAQIKQEVPEAVLITLTNPVSEAEFMITTQADIVGPNAVSMTQEVTRKISEAGKKLWFYAWGRQRFRCGYVDWRLRNRGAIREWYSYTSRAPFNPLDGKRHDSWNDSPPFIGPDGPISTLGMEEVTQGRLDFFYLATLEHWLERAKTQGLSSADAQAILDDLERRVRPDYSYYYNRVKETNYQKDQFNANYEEAFNWRNEEFDEYRRLIAQAISALRDACLGYPSAAERSVTSSSSAIMGHSTISDPVPNSREGLRLTHDDSAHAQPKWSPDGRAISYISEREGVRRIAVFDLDDQTERTLSVDMAGSSYYSWSLQADRIAYTSRDADGDIVAVVSLNDGGLVQIGPGRNPVFSPDGRQLAYTTDADVMVFDFALGRVTNVSQHHTVGVMERLAWSPDGRTIYYSRDGDLWSVGVDVGGNRRLVRRNQTGLAVPPTIENPVISPDASKVYVTLNCDGLYAGVSDNRLAVYDLSSGTLEIIADANSWALSPDGLKLVWNIGDALVAYDVISGIKTEVVKGREPFFSPDGDRIVYLHRQAMCEENDVWITHMPQ